MTVDAVQYTFQRLEDLPEWLTQHTAYTAMGTMAVGKDAVGKLLVPINGQIASATQDDFIVRIPRGDDYELLILKPAAFEADYAAVDVPADAEPVLVETPAAAPAADEAQASPSSGSKGKAKTTAAAEPEAEAPTPEA
ncbi:hypothetical protein D869_gp268 [Caulobacter phage CcrRogue]|uniref:Uncharacterized protein n=1 Tax=Caulobacter phage CcrRogue TaxID=2927986 RepID=K4JNR4_9CAUD|nr:hypothetical protein D869_gp268 [Caulobacter phage CcrRogue]AFU86646.1 hypothetical protein CcrRogue_gp164 [Caulobacter phage CcrRogue]